MRHKRHCFTAFDFAKLSESFSFFLVKTATFLTFIHLGGTEFLKKTVVRALKDNFVYQLS